MESGEAREDEQCSCDSSTQGDANEPREYYSEHSSSTCRIFSRGSQETFWPTGLPRELPPGIPLYWGTSSDSIDAIEAGSDSSSSSNACGSIDSKVSRNFNVNVEASNPTGRHHRTYRRNPFSSNGPRGNQRQQRGFLHVPSSLQAPIFEGAIGNNTLNPITKTNPLRQPYFNTNGWFPDEHLLAENMEENPTQKATQPIMDQRRGDLQTMDNETDEGDVICILHPASIPACRAVDLIARATPQHILQNRGLSRLFDKPEDQDSQAEIQQDLMNEHRSGSLFGSVRSDEEVRQGSSKDIALRLTSRLRDPCMGFVFGRAEAKCDIVLSRVGEYPSNISGAHFRIYFNPVGVLMIQDMSTNGTFFDKNFLSGARMAAGSHSKRMIAGGEIIELLLDSGETEREVMRFLVTMPRRDDTGNLFNHNLAKYIAWRDQAERRAQAFAQAAVNGLPSTTPPVYIPFNPFNDPITDAVASSDDNHVDLNLANRKFNHGMEWSGGDRFNVVGYIGRGAFANVYKLATKRDGELYAAKQIEKRHFMKNNKLDSKIHNEMHIMRKLCHPNIVKFVDHQDEPRHLYIIMEYVPGGDLTSFIKAGTAMAEYMCQSVAQQICDAVEYLHGRNVTHRDIKPDNILIQTRDPLLVKLSDFGLSKWVANEETFLKSFCGTLLYCAPEIYPEYELYKAGGQGKRARNRDTPLKTSPYKPSVDTWALGAVLYHLLCGTPPFRGGSSDDRGSLMLQIVMTTPLDLGRLRNAGVSEEGIEFVSKMLVVDPAGRSTEAELLKHPWITKIGPGDERDVQMEGGLGTLGCIDEDGDGLDASQLSLTENPGIRGIDNGEEELDTDTEAIEGGRQSKRVKLDDSDDQLQGSEGPSIDEISYPQLPGVPTDSVYSEPAPPPMTTPGRLFGEIGASALRSSGVLGYNAHAALQMPLEGSRDESFDTSASWIDDARIMSDEGVPAAARYPPALHGPARMGSAPSLLGAEALVGQLNMASLGSGPSAPSSGNTSEVPGTPKSRDASLAPHGSISGSRGSSQVPRSVVDQATSRRQKTNSSETPSAHYGAIVPGHHRSEGSPIGGGGGAQNIEPELCKPANSASPPLATTTTIEEKTSVSGGEAESGVDQIGEGNMQAKENASQSQHAILANVSASASDSGSTSGRVARDSGSPVSFPKPPPRFGTLTALPGSLCNTTIRLERRITYYGRDPSSHVQHSDPKESRIPKNALDVIFWRPGIEAMIESGKDWSTLDGLYAIVHTRTSQNIKINGVKLTKGEGCWNYGRLHTGDVITIFGPHDEGDKVEGKSAEYLKFRCDFSIGLSAQPRAQDQARFVVEKEEEKFMQNQMRRSMSSASDGSKSTA